MNPINLKKYENKLKPYNLCVSLFNQSLTEDPEFVKIIYNDFRTPPEFTTGYVSTGKYQISIVNYNSLGITIQNRTSISAEYIIAGSASEKLEAKLSTDHDVITLFNIELSFTSLNDFIGSYVLFYYNYY